VHRQNSRPLLLESLEARNLLAAGILDNAWLGVLGTKGDDFIDVRMVDGEVRVRVADHPQTFVEDGPFQYFSSVPAIAILGLAGNDTITIDDNVSINVFVEGGKGNDWIELGSGHDAVMAGAGNDTILGGDGVDILFGAAGDDILLCGDGNDLASGGRGRDAIYGGEGDDIIIGDAGHDAIYGEWGDDACDGMGGNDLVDGGAGDDQLLGDSGKDSIFGGGDNDRIDGGAGKDFCQGNDGDDMLKGGSGVDHLDGGDGQNLLDKDKGKDLLVGGLEADLDLNLFAAGSLPWGAWFNATYDVSYDNGGVNAKFHVRVQADAAKTFDVVVNNRLVGQITTNNSGYGELIFATMPSGDELPFPVDFPTVRSNTKIRVGSTMQARFSPAFFVEREVVLPQLPTVN
jgi:Ca2+-binding RTX toxin-like protein